LAIEQGRKLAMKKYYVFSILLGSMLVIMYSAYGKAFCYGSKLIVDGMSSPKSIKWKLHCIKQSPNKQKGNNKIQNLT